jgi:hypothetical protein
MTMTSRATWAIVLRPPRNPTKRQAAREISKLLEIPHERIESLFKDTPILLFDHLNENRAKKVESSFRKMEIEVVATCDETIKKKCFEVKWPEGVTVNGDGAVGAMHAAPILHDKSMITRTLREEEALIAGWCRTHDEVEDGKVAIQKSLEKERARAEKLAVKLDEVTRAFEQQKRQLSESRQRSDRAAGARPALPLHLFGEKTNNGDASKSWKEQKKLEGELAKLRRECARLVEESKQSQTYYENKIDELMKKSSNSPGPSTR